MSLLIQVFYRSSRWTFNVLGIVSAVVYWHLAVGEELAGGLPSVTRFLGLMAGLFVLYGLATALCTAHRAGVSRPTALQVLVWAIFFRLALLPAGLPIDNSFEELKRDLNSNEITYRSFLLYDNDVWRYLWDGHVFASGIDPYRWSPAELELLADNEDPDAMRLFDEELWYDVFDRVSYETYRTVYPPVAQALFRCHHSLAPASVFVWKLLIAAFDLATCLLLFVILRNRGAPPTLVVLYAWNPLVIKEFAGSGHVDAVMIFFLMLSIHLVERGYQRRALAAYAMAVLAKVTPILLLPFFLKRVRPSHWWPLAMTLAVGYLPFVASLETMVRSLSAFAREWVFNPGPWLFVHWAAENILGRDGRTAASLTTAGVTLGCLALAVARDDGSFRSLVSGSFLVLGGFLLFGAAVMPWYLVWVLPLATLRAGTESRGVKRPEVLAWVALTALCLLSYLIYVDQREHRWWLWVEYLGFFGVFAGAVYSNRFFGRPSRESDHEPF